MLESLETSNISETSQLFEYFVMKFHRVDKIKDCVQSIKKVIFL